MLKVLKLEWYKMKKYYISSLIGSVLLSIIIIIPKISGYSYNHNIEIWEESCEIFALIFPILAVLPTYLILYYKGKDDFFVHTTNKISKKKYIFCKWVTTFLGSSIIIFLTSFVGLVICLYFIKTVVPSGDDYGLEKFAGYYFANRPFVYGFLLSLWRGLLGGLIGTFGFVLSLYRNNIFIILTGPFVYTMLENCILAGLGIPQYRLITSFDPSTLIAFGVCTYFIGPIILISFIIITIIYFSFIKKEKIYYI